VGPKEKVGKVIRNNAGLGERERRKGKVDEEHISGTAKQLIRVM